MTDKRQAKRQKLRDDLLRAAADRIERDGLAKLRARDLASDVDCALGALYNVFADLDDLILHVNSLTLHALDDCLSHVEHAHQDAPPQEQLIALAHGYLDFAMAHRNSWAALFDHQMPDGASVPDWHLNEHAVLFTHIIRPLGQLMPGLDPEEAALTARGLFSATHGVVALGLQNRFSAVPPDKIREMLVLLIGGFARSASF
ncbi:TetR/AcrR family transcriptional regulator [Rhizobium sp. RU36D]|uniref:TetR/AcrR family transcriptional regulator n=1 Tax=Rhizobium sp. RU36D TaxID=1907415 RepID=UPI0009D84F0C|nr:TetR/AcrR family transcriptional regulator [Rhizobium sp. RU36D]SMD15741.1 transcriptional regulator, TetR family [Rhizobium sp. RU36D]